MKRCFRATPVGGLQLRRAGDGAQGQFDAVVLNYNVVDDYNTTFIPGCFTKSLKARKPRVCWSHDWSDPIGQVIDFIDTDKSLTVTCQLDDFDAVEQARRAWVQMDSGTIDQFSVGFWMQAYDMPATEGGPIAIKRGQLDEISPVLVGAVPKTKLLAVRSRLLRIQTADGAEAMVSAARAMEILAQLGIGDIDFVEAATLLKAEAVVPPGDAVDPPKGDDEDKDPPQGPQKTQEELDAEAQAEADRLAAEALAQSEADAALDALIAEGLAVVGR